MSDNDFGLLLHLVGICWVWSFRKKIIKLIAKVSEMNVTIFKVNEINKNNKTEMRNTITEMKKYIKGNYCRLNDTEE